MLAVGIHLHKYLAAPGIKPGSQRGFLAKIARQLEVSHLGMGGAQLMHHAGGVVLAAIVHHNQLDPGRQLPERGQRLRHDNDQACAFVEGRHDA